MEEHIAARAGHPVSDFWSHIEDRHKLSGNGFGECDGYHEMGDLRLALSNPTGRSRDRPGRM
jgi:hypothetical protein